MARAVEATRKSLKFVYTSNRRRQTNLRLVNKSCSSDFCPQLGSHVRQNLVLFSADCKVAICELKVAFIIPSIEPWSALSISRGSEPPEFQFEPEEEGRGIRWSQPYFCPGTSTIVPNIPRLREPETFIPLFVATDYMFDHTRSLADDEWLLLRLTLGWKILPGWGLRPSSAPTVVRPRASLRRFEPRQSV